MPGRAVPKWLPYVGYPAFFLLALAFFVHLTLPYEAIQARIVDEARQQGYQLSMTSLGPGLFFGVTAKGVMVSSDKPTASTAAPDAPASAFLIDSVTVRPGLFPPGLHVSAHAFGGDVDGYVSNKSKGVSAIELHGQNLELARAGLKPLVGLDMEGKLKFDVDMTVNTTDFTKTVGSIKVSGKELALNGGTVSMIDLPKATLGTLDVKLKAESGKTNIETFTLQGGDIDAKADGDINLAPALQTSRLKAKVEFKPGEDWLGKNSFIKTGLSLAGHPNRDGYYTATLDGLLMSPRANLTK
ncbi:MAG: type II secretion system protein GspN [Deltaproteobacteria bacterium]|nr:type II secretion system protein GspN [Deltaproteobacteria bacterium]